MSLAALRNPRSEDRAYPLRYSNASWHTSKAFPQTNALRGKRPACATLSIAAMQDHVHAGLQGSPMSRRAIYSWHMRTFGSYAEAG